MKSNNLNESLVEDLKRKLSSGMTLKEIATLNGVSQASLKRLLKEENSVSTKPNLSFDMFVFPEHAGVYEELLVQATEKRGLYNCFMASSMLRTYYLSHVCSYLKLKDHKVLELDKDSDLIALLNPLVEDIPLSVAISRDVADSSPNILLIRDPELIEPNVWALLFALVRDIPALNLACVSGWLADHEEISQSLLTIYRDHKFDFSFGTISQESLQNASAEVKDSQLGEMSREDFHALLTSLKSE